MKEHEILEQANAAKREFGTKCSKYVGAVTVELLRRALQEHGINTSPSDVFIKGVAVEIDLLIPKAEVEPQDGLLYQPEDVLFALEVKNRGAFGDKALSGIRRNFQEIRRSNQEIRCLYVTLSERTGYKWAATEDKIDGLVYTLFWNSGPEKNLRYESSDDWQRLINEITSALVL